jgi:hypothetical protein
VSIFDHVADKWQWQVMVASGADKWLLAKMDGWEQQPSSSYVSTEAVCNGHLRSNPDIMVFVK